jgi:hypothetical protein
MATSKLPEKWIAGALIFSGRRDPTWEVSEAVVKRLQKLWGAMPPSSKGEASTSRLGYRGVFLRSPDGREWRVFDGAASLTGAGGIEVRTDAGREFEKTLLASAPTGLLPDPLERG